MPLINNAVVIDFDGVVTHTAAFESFTRVMLESELAPLLSMFTSVSLVSAITGSASGGLRIFMLTITGSTHRDAYPDVGMVTVVVPVVSTLISVRAAALFL